MSSPQLRFKEFIADWEPTTLGNFISERNETAQEAVPIYSLTIQDGVTPKTERYERSFLVTDEDEAYKLVRQNDFAYNPMNLRFGAIAKHSKEHPVQVSKYYNIFYCDNSVNSSFCELYFKTYKMIRFYDKMSTGSLAEKKRVHFSDFLKFNIPFPKLDEQTKIANFLTAVDEKITQLTQKHDLLTQYKKGVMQQIFSQELRFKDDDGADFPDWEEKTLDEVALSISNGLSLDQSVERTGYMVTRIETISDKNINLEKVGYIQTEQDISLYKLNVGDILFSNINSISHIGKVVFVDKDYQLYHGMNLLRIVINQTTNNAKFVFYQLSSERMKQNFETKANKAVNQASINQTELKKTELKIPSKPEQTKIANLLTSIDDKISATKAQLEAVNQYKQGLLQQMFV